MDDEKEHQELYVSWNEIEEMCGAIVERLKEINFTPEVIITPLRGGAIPAVLIAYLIGIRNIIAINAERTEDDSPNAKNKELILDRLPTKEQIEYKNVLLIDEIVGTGETLTKIHHYLVEQSPKKIVSAILFDVPNAREGKNLTADIYIKATDKWVVFPWEKSLN